MPFQESEGKEGVAPPVKAEKEKQRLKGVSDKLLAFFTSDAFLESIGLV